MTALASLLGVREGEERLVLLMLLHAACMGFARVFTGTAATTLFIVTFGSAALPYTYIGLAVMMPLASLIYTRVSQRLLFGRLLAFNLVSLVILLIGFRAALLMPDNRIPIAALAIGYWVIYLLTALEFWGLAGRLFNVRQGKRLYGLIGSGEVAATVLGGLLIPGLVRWMGPANLLVLAAAAMAGSLTLFMALRRLPGVRLDGDHEVTQKDAPRPSILELGRERYILLIFVLFFVYNFDWAFVDNVYYNVASARYPDAVGLAGFVGVFQAVCGLIGLICGLFLSGIVLGRLGVRVGLLIYPVATLALSLSGNIFAFQATLFFWLSVVNKTWQETLNGAFYRPSILVLYQPLSRERRVQVQALTEGVFGPVASGLGGVALLALNKVLHFTSPQLVGVVTGLTVVWLVVALACSRDYGRALTESISHRILAHEDLDFSDASSIEVVRNGLRNDHPGVVIYSLSVLKNVDPSGLAECLVELFDHPAPEVRQYVVEAAARLEASTLLVSLQDRLAKETTLSVRAAALRAIGELGGDEVTEVLMPFLTDENDRLRAAAMVGLLSGGALEGVIMAGERLIRCVHADDPRDRALAARVLGEVGTHGFYRPMLQLLVDDDLDVRTTALAAAGQMQNPKLWPLVFENLSVPGVQGAAVAALRKGGNSLFPELQKAFARETDSRNLRVAFVRIARNLEGPEVVRWLESLMEDRDRVVRHHVLSELSRRRYRAEAEAVERCHLNIETEVRHCTWAMAACLDLASHPTASLLCSSLRFHLQERRDRILMWLSFLYDPSAVREISESLSHGTPERRAAGIEVLDLLLSKSLKPIVLPLFDDIPVADSLHRVGVALSDARQAGRTDVQWLAEILTLQEEPSDPWLQTSAIVAWVQWRHADPDPLLADIRSLADNASDPLVCETATWALRTVSDSIPGHDTRSNKMPNVLEKVQTSMITVVEKIMLLKTLSLFSEVPDEVLVRVAGALEYIDARPGETIVTQGDVGRSLYIIISGSMRVHEGDTTLIRLKDGNIFGEMSVLDSEPRSASVTAEDHARLLRLDQDALYDMMSDYPEITRGIVRMLSGRLRRMAGEISELHKR